MRKNDLKILKKNCNYVNVINCKHNTKYRKNSLELKIINYV